MAKEQPEHAQVTEEQIELWQVHPVTVALLKCFAWSAEDMRDGAGSGALVDSSNADMTHALLHRALGYQDAMREAQQPTERLDHYNMIFRPEPKDDDG